MVIPERTVGVGGAAAAADGAAADANAAGGDQNVPGDGGNAGGNPGGGNPAGAYLATFYTGQLPAAIGAVAKAVAAKQSLEEQRAKAEAEALFQFLQTNGNDLRDLNGNDSLFTSLVAFPDSN